MAVVEVVEEMRVEVVEERGRRRSWGRRGGGAEPLEEKVEGVEAEVVRGRRKKGLGREEKGREGERAGGDDLR